MAVTAFGQHESRDRARQKIQNHKSEAAARQPAVRNQNNDQTRIRGNANSPGNRTAGAVRKAERKPAPGSTAMYKRPATNGRKNPGVVKRDNTGSREMEVRKHNRKPGTPSHARHEEQRKHYTTPNRTPVRKVRGVSNHAPVRFKKVHNYRSPSHVDVIWTHRMFREYRILYPEFRYWYYPVGYRIVTVPAYRAWFHIGEVRNVYGRVDEVWYSWANDEYHLYFGGAYPYHDFTVILSGRDARRFHRNPERFFGGRYIWVTGLVSTFEGKPEIMVMRRSQVHLY